MNISDKTILARELNISRGSLYYRPKQEVRDWRTKCLIEEALRDNQSYGHKRLADHLKINKKRVLRVMKKYGIKPYRRRGNNWKNTKGIIEHFPNLLLTSYPSRANQIWTSDFTYLGFKRLTVYVATVMDLFTKEIVGLSILTNHSSKLTINVLLGALNSHPRPEIFHSDNGREL